MAATHYDLYTWKATDDLWLVAGNRTLQAQAGYTSTEDFAADIVTANLPENTLLDQPGIIDTRHLLPGMQLIIPHTQ